MATSKEIRAQEERALFVEVSKVHVQEGWPPLDRVKAIVQDTHAKMQSAPAPSPSPASSSSPSSSATSISNNNNNNNKGPATATGTGTGSGHAPFRLPPWVDNPIAGEAYMFTILQALEKVRAALSLFLSVSLSLFYPSRYCRFICLSTSYVFTLFPRVPVPLPALHTRMHGRTRSWRWLHRTRRRRQRAS